MPDKTRHEISTVRDGGCRKPIVTLLSQATVTVQNPQGKLAVKLKEAAAMLSMSERTLRRKIKDRELAVCRATRHITIAVDELKRFLAKNTVKF